MRTLTDTGSPVSIIKEKCYRKHVESDSVELLSPSKRLRSISNDPLKIIGVVSTEITLSDFGERSFIVNLYIVEDHCFIGDISRDFVAGERLALTYDLEKVGDLETVAKVNVFNVLPHAELQITPETPKQIVSNAQIDFDAETKNKLANIVVEVEKMNIEPTTDDYAVRIPLNDNSAYAYASRRFAYAERIEIRKIIDDLLKRSVIKPSILPYCARVIPVRKKSGKVRLCVDLRPLNSRVIKQKYPFPIIEDCLSRIGGKYVFTV